MGQLQFRLTSACGRGVKFSEAIVATGLIPLVARFLPPVLIGIALAVLLVEWGRYLIR
jgi:hypothetical protein